MIVDLYGIIMHFAAQLELDSIMCNSTVTSSLLNYYILVLDVSLNKYWNV